VAAPLTWSNGGKREALREGTVTSRALLAALAVCGVAATRVDAQPAEPPAQTASATPGAEKSTPDAATPDPVDEGDANRPWADGVSEADQAAARELHLAGNREFAESRFAQALAKYREAIGHWDHPAIRYNMVVCLINLDRPLEARVDLEHSLAHGSAPLGNENYAQALTYRKLLDAQLARLKITCPEQGAVVTLDGKYLFIGPGSAEQFLLPGGHQVMATKPGLVTASHALTLVAGQPAAYEIRPTAEVATAIAPRWKYWKYVAVGGSVAIAGGVISYLAARSKYDEYDRDFASRCPGGCDAARAGMFPSLRIERDTADIEQSVAFAALSIGGAAVLTGVIGTLLDQPRVRPMSREPAVHVVPGGAVVTIGWSL
jgi:hypothetical protein